MARRTKANLLEEISELEDTNEKLFRDSVFWKKFAKMAAQAYKEATGKEIFDHTFQDHIDFDLKIHNEAKHLATLYNENY